MPAPRFTYTLEAQAPTGWIVILVDRLEFCRGALWAREEQTPRTAFRLRRVEHGDPTARPNAKVPDDAPGVLDSLPECPRAAVGLVAGWPTGRQLIAAAVDALEKVARVPEDYATDEERERAERALGVLR